MKPEHKSESKAHAAEAIQVVHKVPFPEDILGIKPISVETVVFNKSLDMPGKSGASSVTANPQSVGVGKWKLEFFPAPLDCVKVTWLSQPGKVKPAYVPRTSCDKIVFE